MTATHDHAAPEPRTVIAELQRKFAESRAELSARSSAYSERIADQAAANDVLKVSPGDPQPMFDLLVERARLYGGKSLTPYLRKSRRWGLRSQRRLCSVSMTFRRPQLRCAAKG